MQDDTTRALARYNRLFDNPAYQALAERIASDLGVDRDTVQVADLMNAITDLALSLNGHSHYQDAWVSLACCCGQHSLPTSTIDQIYNYLLLYRQIGDTRAEDFQATAKTLIRCDPLRDPLGRAVAHANGIHGWRGRAAYHLLAAADYLVQAATQLLMDGNLSYVGEKLRRALHHLPGALMEGLRYSECPEQFDCSATRFPSADDGKEQSRRPREQAD